MTTEERLNLFLLEEWDSRPSELQTDITLNPDLAKIKRVMERAYNLGKSNTKTALTSLLEQQEEIINSPIRFNGVAVERIKGALKAHGFSIPEPF